MGYLSREDRIVHLFRVVSDWHLALVLGSAELQNRSSRHFGFIKPHVLVSVPRDTRWPTRCPSFLRGAPAQRDTPHALLVVVLLLPHAVQDLLCDAQDLLQDAKDLLRDAQVHSPGALVDLLDALIDLLSFTPRRLRWWGTSGRTVPTGSPSILSSRERCHYLHLLPGTPRLEGAKM